MRTCFLLPGLLAASLTAHAQTFTTTVTLPAQTPYQVQYDTLQGRAARVRTQIAASTVSFTTSYAGLFGTRRVIVSQGFLPKLPVLDDTPRSSAVLKRETVKHKTRGAQIRKVTYYTAGRRPRLYEYYEDGRLVQQELYDYPLANGAGGYSFVTMRWVQGDYLLVQQRSRTSAGGRTLQEQVFTQVVTPR